MTPARLAPAALALGAAAALTPAPSPARQAPARQGLREVAADLAQTARRAAADLGQSAVRVGYFTPFGIDHGNAGGALMSELGQALQGFADPGAGLELYGSYGLVDSQDGGAKVIVVEARLRRTATGRDEKGFQFEGFVRSNTDIARLTGATVSFKPDAEYKDPAKGRNKDILDGLPPGAGKAPKVRPHVEGALVRARPDSPYAVEVRKKPVDAPGDHRPVPATLKDGLAFVPIGQGEVYEVRVLNASAREVAVSVSVDGIDTFAFSEDRDPVADEAGRPVPGPDGKPRTRPRFTHWIVGPAKGGVPGEVVVYGWHRTADPTRNDSVSSFLVTEYGKGAASRFPTKAQGKVGLITVGVSHCFPAGTARSGGETGFGPDRQVPQTPVKRVIDPPHEFVTVRYDR